MAIKTFQKSSFGRQGGVFQCRVCGRRTRLTAAGQTSLCGQCDEASMIENGINDGGYAPTDLANAKARIAALQAEAVRRGGVFE